MNRLETNVYNSNLKVILEENGKSSYVVYLFDTVHNKALNIKTFDCFTTAHRHYKMRCAGL